AAYRPGMARLVNFLPPNPRQQRNPSAAPPSPLSPKPLGHGRTMRRWSRVAMSLALVLIAVSSPAQTTREGLTLPDHPKLIAGFGAHPLSTSVSSMWFASAPMPKSG